MHGVIHPRLRTRAVRLVSAKERFGAEPREELSRRGLRGLPGEGVFASLWPGRHEGVAAQFLVEDPATDRVGGYASLHALSPQGRYVKCSVAADPDVLGPEALTDAFALTVNYGFSMWNVRKVYFWVVDLGLPALRATGVEIVREGTLLEYVRDGERLRTVRIFAVYREAWDAVGAEHVRRAVEAE